MSAAVRQHGDPPAGQRGRGEQRLRDVDQLRGGAHDVCPGRPARRLDHRVSLTSAPVCDAAARVLAALRPTVSTSTGLPAAAAASTNARPSRKSSA